MKELSRRVHWSALAAAILVACVAVFLLLLRGASESPRETGADTLKPSQESVLGDPTIVDSGAIERSAAIANAAVNTTSESPKGKDPTPSTVKVRARVTDLAGRPLDYMEIALLVPNRDPFSSQADETPARAPSEIWIRDRSDSEPRDVNFYILQPRGEKIGLSFEVPAKFDGELGLVAHGVAVDRVNYRAGGADPVFRVDLAGLRARLSTMRIGVSDEVTSEGFIIRVEAEGGDVAEAGLGPRAGAREVLVEMRTDKGGRVRGAGRSGERRSFDGGAVELTSMPAGKYRIAARSDDSAYEPVEVTLGAGEDRVVTLAAVARCDVKLRVWPPPGRAMPEIGTPWIKLGVHRVRFPEQNGIADRRVIDAGGGERCVEFTFRGMPPGPLVFLVATGELAASLVPGDNGVVEMRLSETSDEKK